MGRSKRGSTQLANVDLCERRWAFENIEGLEPIKTPKYFVRGQLIHTALSYWWALQLPEHRQPAWYREKPLGERLNEEGRGYPSFTGLALNVVTSYAQAYPAPDDHWEPLYVEHEFEATWDVQFGQPLSISDSLPPHEFVTAKPDLIVKERETGRVLMVDHKSGYPKAGEYDLSWQFSYYRLVLEAADVKIDGLVIQTVKMNSDGRECKFDRIEAPLNRHLDHSMREALGRRIEREAVVRARGWGRPNFGPHTCYTRYGPCPYRSICLSEDPEREKLINFKKRDDDT